MIETDGAMTVRISKQDKLTKTPVFIDYVHHEVHDANTWRHCTLTTSLADTASVSYYMVPSATKDMHFIASVDTAGKAYSYFYEQPTTSGLGSLIVPINMNRSNPVAPTATIYVNTTTSANGTTLCENLINGGTGPNSIGGDIRDNTEWILAKSKTYLLKVTNVAGGAKDVSINIQWYEE